MSDTTPAIEANAKALLEEIRARGATMITINPEAADLFRLLEVLKAEGLIEKVQARGPLASRYQLTEAGKANK
jgi:DNA-binding PadR family transcriptional regulator